MTYSFREVAAALQLAEGGLEAKEISRRIAVPRRTISDWLNGRIPRGRLGPDDLCAVCGHAPHEPDDLPAAYAYLLGVYLGDGCISPHPRGVFKLRVCLDARYPGIVSEVAESMQCVRPMNAVRMATRYVQDSDGNDNPSCVGRLLILQVVALPLSTAWAWEEASPPHRLDCLAASPGLTDARASASRLDPFGRVPVREYGARRVA